MSAINTPTIDQILADCSIFGIFSIPSFDVDNRLILSCQILDTVTGIVAAGVRGQSQDDVKRGCLASVKKAIEDMDKTSFIVNLITLIEAGKISNSRIADGCLEFDYEQIRCRLCLLGDKTLKNYELMAEFLSQTDQSPIIILIRRLFVEKKISDVTIRWSTRSSTEQASFTCCQTGLEYVGTIPNGTKVLERILNGIDEIDLDGKEISNSRIDGKYLEFDHEQIRYRLHPNDKRTVAIFLSHIAHGPPTIRLMRRLFEQKKISDVTIQCNSGAWVEEASFTCCLTGTKYTKLNFGLQNRLDQILEEIDLGDKTISIPLAAPSGVQNPNIALHRGKYRGVYQVVGYDPNTMFFELDAYGPVKDAWHIVSRRQVGQSLTLTLVVNFDQLAKTYPDCWMAVAGYKLAELSNDDGAYVVCYQSDDDPIVGLYKFYIENFVF